VKITTKFIYRMAPKSASLGSRDRICNFTSFHYFVTVDVTALTFYTELTRESTTKFIYKMTPKWAWSGSCDQICNLHPLIVSAYRYIAITNLPIIAVFDEYLRQFLIDLHQIYRHSSVPKTRLREFFQLLSSSGFRARCRRDFFCDVVPVTV